MPAPAGGRLVSIGRGEPNLEKAMLELARRHPGQVGVHIGFDETEARRIYAGSDFLLMPSRYEPCVSQLYAQCFGSLPIARCTGGLADTIVDGVTGFLFREETAQSYLDAVMRAINVYHCPSLLNAMRCKAMAAPMFWSDSVEPLQPPVPAPVEEYRSGPCAGTPMMAIRRRFGAQFQGNGRTCFGLWAPDAREVRVETADGRDWPLEGSDSGFEATLPCPPGTRYRYRIDGRPGCRTRPRSSSPTACMATARCWTMAPTPGASTSGAGGPGTKR